MLENVLKPVESEVASNKKYISTQGGLMLLEDLLSQGLLPNILYEHTDDQTVILTTLAVKALPFMTLNIGAYWDNKNRNKVIFSQLVGFSIMWNFGYHLYNKALTEEMLPRVIAAASLFPAGFVSAVVRIGLDGYLGVYKYDLKEMSSVAKSKYTSFIANTEPW